ncbi:ATP-binding protein [Alienimonas californiensis]|uniref:Chromosome partition protein Smc n=1 Tax=Alienimonas californiensis TaxID=2527989 RepID=A0A517P8B5_9PLAN|nr:AAA family ATPase [Alienimonas californiensis]QDT15603.1 Chromosome partition protein Smc [Alienimonas californiensis]
MRIERLDLIAFGPFAGLSLDFSAPGLHVVYGPNEAGKSTALRAVRDALFGIPGQSPDNHRHDYRALRIGMTLAPGGAAAGDVSDGRLSFRRRKGNKNTLLGDGDAETALPDDRLAPFLNGTTEEAFNKLHGLRLKELSEGSEELLAGGGEVGQLLFASSGGLSGLRHVREGLRKEMDELFLARGRNPTINADLRTLKELRQQTHNEGLSPTDWANRTAAIEDLRRTRDELKKEAETKRAEAARARRLRAARGTADRLTDALARQAELEEQVSADAPLRAAADRLEHLRRRAAAAAAAAEDREGLDRRAAAATASAERALRDLAPAGAAADWSPPDLSDPQRAHLAAAADAHSELARDLSDAASKRRAAAERVEELTATLADRAAISETAADALAAALRRAAALPGPAAAVKLDRQIEALTKKIAAGLARLRGFDGTAADLSAFSIPAEATLDRFAADRQTAVARLAEARGLLERCEADADDARANLAALSAAGPVPSEADLAAARQAREEVWAAVRSRLTAAGQTDSSPDGLIHRQEQATADADEAADALRAEAKQVERVAALKAEIARHEARAATARDRRAAAESAVERLDADWAAQWPALSVAPHPPAEMRSWRATAAAVEEDYSTLVELRDRRADDVAEATAAAAELAARLAEVEAGLDRGEADVEALRETLVALSWEELQDRAARARKRLDVRVGQQGVMEENLQRMEAARSEAAAAEADAKAGLAAWAADWATATAPLGLSIGGERTHDERGEPSGPNPAAVRAFLNGWGTVQGHRKDAAEARGRLAEIDAAQTRFAADAAALAGSLAPDLPPDADPAEQIALLSERLAAATERARELRDLPAEIRTLQRDLDVQRAGEEADAFLAAARAGDPDELDARAESLEAEAQDLDERRDQAITAVRDAEAALDALDTRGAAAEAEQKAQGLLAKLDDDADRYARFALADALLAAAAERHRARHQGPVLARAGRLFARLTGGSFAGLDVTLEHGDEPTLVGVRPATVAESGEEGAVTIPGETLLPPAMSDGTRDALYLALRLAGLAETASGRPVPPLIVDDALERFDDARTAAALATLAELADPASAASGNGTFGGTVQVILFTHHARVAELAAGLTNARATVHRLPTDHLPGERAEPPTPRLEPPAAAPAGPPPPRRPAVSKPDAEKRATTPPKPKPKAPADDARQTLFL